ncbi:MAG: hypothetical protein ACUVXI_17825 [bacterium]
MYFALVLGSILLVVGIIVAYWAALEGIGEGTINVLGIVATGFWALFWGVIFLIFGLSLIVAGAKIFIKALQSFYRF